MINTSSEYKSRILANRKFHLYATITLLDGTVLDLTDDDIMQGGMEFEDAVSGDSTFQIGAAIIGKNVLTLNNYNGKFDAYDFTNATVVPYVGLELSSSIEKLKKGFFTVDDPNVAGNLLNIESLDNMTRFEKDFSGVSISFPNTALAVLLAICDYCGVTLTTGTFTNSDYIIQFAPTSDALTCLDMVSYIAQISGNFARINVNGDLELKWYDMTAFETSESTVDGGTFTTTTTPYSDGDTADGGNFTDYTSGVSIDGGTFENQNKYHHLYDFGSNPTVAIDDVVITGIQVSDNAETPNTVLFGSNGYVLSISGNPLIQSQSDAQTIANTVGAKIVGMRFRPFSASILSDPSIEAGDAAHVSVRTNRGYFTYHSYITSASFKINSRESVKCSAETPSKNSSKGYSALTKAIVETRKNTEVQLTSYDLAVQRMNRLAANTLGYHFTEVKQDDGSIITYRHDKPLLADSTIIYKEGIDGFFVSTDGGKTYSNGFDSQGNAVLNILDAIGVKANWIKTGKLFSTDGGTIIDMAYGVANSDNISFVDNIQNGFPLTMPFNIDNNVSKINKILLKYTQQSFRAYSTSASSGGNSSETSSTDKSLIVVSELTGNFQTNGTTVDGGSCSALADSNGSFSGYTGEAAAYSPHSHPFSMPSHQHVVSIPSHSHGYHSHYFTINHTHGVEVEGHSHTVDIPAHTHGLNFGIQEQAISDYSFDVYVDGEKQVSIANNSENDQGIIDLTAYTATVGWHTIEIHSTTLKRVSAQINIKSYIRS